MRNIRLAMIGCGRAAESLHLPAAALAQGVETTVLVDLDRDRANGLAQAYGVPEVRERVAGVSALADAALVALPHHLHAAVAGELLEAGMHVLVEKPLALSALECRELTSVAHRRGLTLAVGMIRRRFPAARFVKRALERDLLGRVERVVVREGVPFGWEVASDFTFRPETGGGVLADSGVYVLDLLAWWFGELRVEGYRDDALGGVEAECEAELRLPSGVPVLVELSRTRDLGASAVIEGDRGVIEAGLGFDGRVRLDLGVEPLVGAPEPPGRSYGNVRELFIEQLEDFARAVASGAKPLVGGDDACAGVSLMAACRAVRQPLELPWVELRSEVPA